ncbi:MAG: hypothetical protein ACD_9C00180G0002 [uncultured bacterium]|nr:MAG: hypothetical protein ACD_9C00180G0002 [uncultured bacterium]
MILVSLFVFLWMLVAFFDYAEFCYLWQLKEYRLDRFKDFISTKQGKSFLKSYLISGRMVLLAAAIFIWTLKNESAFYIFLVIIIFEIIRLVRKFLKKQINRPKLTIKTFLILAGAIVAEIFVLYFSSSLPAVLAAYAFRFVIISIVVSLFFIPTKIVKIAVVRMAARKLRGYPNLYVIGITGSYGKSTVKNFLTQILGSQLKVVMTPKNINTEIGIAKFILKNNFSDKEIFVVEMGAYNVGEIKLICDMVHPSIGILTAINEQHLSLFGSIKKIQKAKYELLFSLPKNGLAIINADNQYCREFIHKLSCKTRTFGEEEKNDPNLLIKKVAQKEDGSIAFMFKLNGKIQNVFSNISGKHNAMNIAACILAANALGMSMEKIIHNAKKLQLPEGTLQKYKYGESVVIDDSYNANPDGFAAALAVLDGYSDEYKKIVITRGMLELGEKSSQLHQEIAVQISQVAKELMIFSSSNEDDLKIAEKKINVISTSSAIELRDYIRKFKKQKAVVLIENRIPENIINEIRKVPRV